MIPKKWLRALGLPALALGAQIARGQAEDWAPCAQDGQTCRISGEALVRYGANGHFVFRIGREDLPCTPEAFGTDPLPRVAKHCEMSPGWRRQPRYRNWQAAGASLGEWTLCANEGDVCRVPGPATVRYGGDGRYAERSADHDIPCNNGVFGDPMEGTAKQCAFKQVKAEETRRRGLPWVPCAKEGERCNFRGPAIVRYGAPARHFYEEGYDGMLCANESFGEDPVPGQPKRCDILRLD